MAPRSVAPASRAGATPGIPALVAGLIALGIVAAPAFPASLSLSPVRLNLSAKQPVGSVVVRNDGTEPSVLQLSVVDWTQTATDDVYGETAELLATPPVFTVPAGGSRVVRVGLRRPPDAHRELSYRLYMQEVPPPLDPDFNGMRMTLRLGVPIFVAPAGMPPAKLDLRWHAVATEDGSIRLSLANAGSEHVKINAFELGAPDGARTSGVQHVSTYVLPGHSREWRVRLDGGAPAGSRLRLHVSTDSVGDQTTSLTVDAT